MKTRAILAATAIIAGSFNPILTFPAWAAVTFPDGIPAATGPTQETKDAMQDQCDALALLHGFNWTGTLDEASIGTALYVSGPTEVGTHSIADAIEGTLEGAGTFTPGPISILGDPYRIGGSVNLFGIQQAAGGHYSASEYDFEGEFDTVYSYSFNCTMKETVFTGAEGYYELAGEFGDSNEAIRANCDAFTALGDNDPRPKWWGEPFHGGSAANPHCRFVGTQGGETEEDRPDEAGVPVEETQTDTLTAHEDAGEGFDDPATVLIGQVVVCISPTTSTQTKKGVPGTWTPKNGYDGSKCTTTYFNSAPWGAGSQDSNGTYISVPLA